VTPPRKEIRKKGKVIVSNKRDPGIAKGVLNIQREEEGYAGGKRYIFKKAIGWKGVAMKRGYQTSYNEEEIGDGGNLTKQSVHEKD